MKDAILALASADEPSINWLSRSDVHPSMRPTFACGKHNALGFAGCSGRVDDRHRAVVTHLGTIH